MPNLAALDRLKSQLLTSGVQEKNQALFQVINQLIDFLRQSVDETTSALKDGGGSGGVGPAGPVGPPGINGIPGIPGMDFSGENDGDNGLGDGLSIPPSFRDGEFNKLVGVGYIIQGNRDQFHTGVIDAPVGGGLNVINPDGFDGGGLPANTELRMNVANLSPEDASPEDYIPFLRSATGFTRRSLISDIVGTVIPEDSYQPRDPTLTALAGFNTNGILTQTALDTFVGRTITPVANQGIQVAQGNGVAGNPALSLDINNLVTDATPDKTADFIPTYDVSAGAPKKVLISSISTSGPPAVHHATHEVGGTDVINGDMAFSHLTLSGGYPQIRLNAAIPLIQWNEIGASADNKKWRFFASGEIFRLDALNDAETAAISTVFTVARNGTITVIGTLNAASLGTTPLNGSQITSGTVADVRLSSNVALQTNELNLTGGSGTGYTGATIEIQTVANPRISFHWPGVVASQLGMDTAGTIRTYDNPGTGFAAFACAGLTCSTLSTAGITNNTGLAHGVYSPTGSGATNISVLNFYPAQWMRVGNTVTVSGKLDVTLPTAGVNSQWYLYPPVAVSIFGADYQCGGVWKTLGPDGGSIRGYSNAILFEGIANYTGLQPLYYTYTYTVV